MGETADAPVHLAFENGQAQVFEIQGADLFVSVHGATVVLWTVDSGGCSQHQAKHHELLDLRINQQDQRLVAASGGRQWALVPAAALDGCEQAAPEEMTTAVNQLWAVSEPVVFDGARRVRFSDAEGA